MEGVAARRVERANLRALFDRLDADGSGRLDAKELEGLFASGMDAEETREAMGLFKTPPPGGVSFEDFCAALMDSESESGLDQRDARIPLAGF